MAKRKQCERCEDNAVRNVQVRGDWKHLCGLCEAAVWREGLVEHASIYRAGVPRLGHFAMMWQTSSMKAPAFNYYETEQQARKALSRWLKDHPRTGLEIRL